MENLAKNPYSQSAPMDNELKIHRRRYSQVSDGTGSDKSLLPAAGWRKSPAGLAPLSRRRNFPVKREKK